MSQQKRDEVRDVRDAVRDAICRRIEAGAAIDDILEKLVEKAPSTLLDIAFGPQAIGGAEITRALLPLLPLLEQRIQRFQISAARFYYRLAELSQEASRELMTAVLERHSQEEWFISFAQKAEGAAMGQLQLLALQQSPRFMDFCLLYVQRGARRGLVMVAEELGRVEPAIALLLEGVVEVGIEAAARALETDPNCGVIEYMAATLGPDIDPLLARLVSRIHRADVLHQVDELLRWYPRASAQLKKMQHMPS